MRIETFVLGSWETNSYLLHRQGRAVAIDPGQDPGPMVEFIRREGLALEQIILTHLHFDHILGAAELKRAAGAEILGPAGDAPLLKLDIGGAGGQGLPKAAPFEFTALPAGKTSFLGLTCLVLATPGHSPGSLSFFFPRQGVVFSGDLLFRGNVGRTDFFGGDEKALFSSIKNRIFILPDETVVYPGHGPTTTVGFEKNNNPFFNRK